jgi:integrase/recombinase XerD
MTDQSILYIVHRRAAEANVTNIRPHDFRRTYISSLFDKNVDISTIMQLAGHDKADQTVQYDRRKSAPKRRAADLFDEG